MMKVLKVRAKKASTKIDYIVEGDSNSINSDQLANEGFMNALAGLKPLVQDILGVGDDWMERMIVHGLTVTPKGTNYTVVIVAKREMEAGSPLNITTPLRMLNISEDDEEANKIALSDENHTRVESVLLHARRFIAERMRATVSEFLPGFGPGDMPGKGVIVEADFTEEGKAAVKKSRRKRGAGRAPRAEMSAAAR